MGSGAAGPRGAGPQSPQPAALTLCWGPPGARLRLALAAEEPPCSPAGRGGPGRGPADEAAEEAAVTGQGRHGGKGREGKGRRGRGGRGPAAPPHGAALRAPWRRRLGEGDEPEGLKNKVHALAGTAVVAKLPRPAWLGAITKDH